MSTFSRTVPDKSPTQCRQYKLLDTVELGKRGPIVSAQTLAGVLSLGSISMLPKERASTKVFAQRIKAFNQWTDKCELFLKTPRYYYGTPFPEFIARPFGNCFPDFLGVRYFALYSYLALI